MICEKALKLALLSMTGFTSGMVFDDVEDVEDDDDEEPSDVT